MGCNFGSHICKIHLLTYSKSIISTNVYASSAIFHNTLDKFISRIKLLMSVFEGFQELESMFANVIKFLCFIVVSRTIFIGIQ